MLQLLIVVMLGAMEGSPQSPVISGDRKACLVALNQLERSTVRFISGETGDLDLVSQMQMLSKEAPSGPFIGLDKATSGSLYARWREWQLTRGSEALTRFIGAVERAREALKPAEDPVTPIGLSKMISALNGETDQEKSLINQAQQASGWIAKKLDDGLPVSRECLESLAVLAKGTETFAETKDIDVLRAFSTDLQTKFEYCLNTGSRPDRAVEIKFDTLEPPDKRASGWLAFARPRTRPFSLLIPLGGPSSLTSPITRKVMPGIYYFYAERDRRQSNWMLHEVGKDGLVPKNLFVNR